MTHLRTLPFPDPGTIKNPILVTSDISLRRSFINYALALAVMIWFLASASVLASFKFVYDIAFTGHRPANPEMLALPLGVVATIIALRATVPISTTQNLFGMSALPECHKCNTHLSLALTVLR